MEKPLTENNMVTLDLLTVSRKSVEVLKGIGRVTPIGHNYTKKRTSNRQQ